MTKEKWDGIGGFFYASHTLLEFAKPQNGIWFIIIN